MHIVGALVRLSTSYFDKFMNYQIVLFEKNLKHKPDFLKCAHVYFKSG